jgi:multiple sugar transport system substrate-binding protein
MAIKRWMGLVAAVALVTLAACGGADEPTAEPSEVDDSESADGDDDIAADDAGAATGDFDWRRFEGEVVRVAALQSPQGEAISDRLAEFEELTGITVEFDMLPQAQFRDRTQVQFAAGSDDPDVFMSLMAQEGLRFYRDGFLEDLWPYIEDPSMTSSDYDFDDFADGPIQANEIDGQLLAVPIDQQLQMLFYRRDVLQELNLELPQTMEELEELAQAIDSAGGPRAFTSRGRSSDAVTQFTTYLYSFGGEYIDASGNPAFDSPEAIEAFEFYGRMIREYGPPGGTTFNWEEVVPLFQQGEVAMITDASALMPPVTDPEASPVAEDVGFAPMPAGPAGAACTGVGWGLSLSRLAANKDAGWYFIQWATGPEMSAYYQNERGNVGARESIGFGERFPDDWVEVFVDCLPDLRSQLPDVVNVPQAREIIGSVIVTAIEGGDVAGAAAQAVEELRQVEGLD